MDSRLKPFGLLFNKSLNDMIRGMRKRKDPELLAEYLRKTIAECREETRSPDFDIKAMAILKLSYLEMYGFDMAWAGFNVLEVMSSQQFQQKRIGYLAAMQSFRDPELLMMATNLLRNDLSSSSLPRVAIALSGLASIVTPFLAQDISEDIVKMLNHSKAYVRKKALLAMYKLVLQYPEAFDTVMEKIKSRLELEDEDPSVVSAAVNVLCELANQVPPSKIVPLAPSLYELLSTSKNNWCLIKILKLFAKLCPAEPRLIGKLRPLIVDRMETTTALSLKYECINCLLRGNMVGEDDFELAARCVGHICTLIEENDQNLKYVALLAISELLRINKQFLAKESRLVTLEITSNDPSIRRKALELLPFVSTEDNLVDLVSRLMDELRSESEDAFELASTVISLCNYSNYANLPNFEWYTEILVELMMLAYNTPALGQRVGLELRNVAVRVKSARSVVVAASITLNLNKELVKKQPELVGYTMWLVGEYIGEYFTGANAATGRDFIKSILDSEPVPETLQAVVKIFNAWISVLSFWSPQQAETVRAVIDDIVEYFGKLSLSQEAELQERASQFLELFRLGQDSLEADQPEVPALLTVGFPSLFDYCELKPVKPSAMARIMPESDLDLTTPVEVPPAEWVSSDDEELVEEVEYTEKPSVPRAFDPYYISMEAEPDASASPGARADQSTDASEDSSPAPDPASATVPTAAPAAAVARRKIQRVKVEIAQDEEDDLPPVSEPTTQKSVFQLGSRLSSVELESPPASELKVKHKTKKKKKTKQILA